VHDLWVLATAPSAPAGPDTAFEVNGDWASTDRLLHHLIRGLHEVAKSIKPGDCRRKKNESERRLGLVRASLQLAVSGSSSPTRRVGLSLVRGMSLFSKRPGRSSLLLKDFVATKRLFLAGLIVLIFGAADVVGSPPVLASGDCYGNFHYAAEAVMANGQGGSYHAPSCFGTFYYGWIGIDGQITFPSVVPYLGNNQDNHSAGWLGVTFQPSSWIQEGWFTGCAGTPRQCRVESLGMYTEVNNATVSPTFYELIDWGTAPLGGASIMLIEYQGGDAGISIWTTRP